MELITLQIDLGRQKETLEYVRGYVDFAKKCGYNSILYYLENAVRTEDTSFLSQDETYSLDEMREIAEYTEAQGLIAIPAFENLGHMEKFLSYPELEHLAECEEGVTGRFYNTDRGDCGCPCKPELYTFMDKYITDVASVFPSEYIHLGLDEVFSFAICPRCRERLAAGETKADMFYRHIMHTYDLVKGMGKTMMIWDDFFECMDIIDRLPRDIIMTTWNYCFVTDEPRGHWTGRVKRDLFAYYEELGFRYMIATYAHKSSSTFNTDTFNEYAKKYKPMGALMTTWERASDFYLGAYPHIALAAREWQSGRLSYGERVKLYTDMLGGDEECARLLLSLSIPSFVSGAGDLTKSAELDFLAMNMLRAQLARALEVLDSSYERAVGEAKDIIGDIYAYIYSVYADAKGYELATRIFNLYAEGAGDFSEIKSECDTLIAGYERCRAISERIWEKYRLGIKSRNDCFEKRYTGAVERLNKVKAELDASAPSAVLYCDLMLHCGYGTPRAEIKVKYAEAADETLVHSGGIKSAAVAFELGGEYVRAFALESKDIEYMLFSVYGEGAIYPLNFRYVKGGKKYVAATVEAVEGCVEHPENVLKNDTQFATLGINDSLAHFNDVDLGRKRHTVKVTFKPLAEYKYE